MSQSPKASPSPDASHDEVQLSALAWADFLYDQYMKHKHKQFLLDNQPSKIDTNEGVTDD